MERVLVIAYDCNPQKGSEAMLAYSWISSLSKSYRVTVITDIRHKASLQDNGIRFNPEYCTYAPDKISSLLRKFHAHNMLYRLFIKSVRKKLTGSEISNYDLIHCLTPAGYFSYNDLYKLGKPVIAGPLGGGLKLPQGFGRYRTFKYLLRNSYYSLIRHNPGWKKYYNNCSKILIGTRYLLEHLPESVHTRTIEFFDTVVDAKKFLPASNRDNETVNIVYSGRMEQSKGCLLLLEAFRLIWQEGGPKLRLIMLGEGSQLGRLKKIVKKAGLEQVVKLPGRVPVDKVREYLRAADIFCLPSLKEPGGTAILEAMACGLPVITTNYGGPSVSVTEECGIKIEPDGYEQYIHSLKQAIKYLAENPEERRRLGRNARQRALTEYSYEKLEDKITNLYKGLFEEKKKMGEF